MLKSISRRRLHWVNHRVQPPRHRYDVCSMAWRCGSVTARLSQHDRVVAVHSLVDVYVGDEVLVELDGRAVEELGVAPGEYTTAVKEAVAVFDEQLVFGIKSGDALSGVKINQSVGCYFIGGDAAVLATSSGEGPVPPRHRADVARVARF